MKQVKKITCINNAGFVQKFKVVWNGGQTGWSDTYPNPQSKSFELAEYRVPANTEVWIEVDAVFGKKKQLVIMLFLFRKVMMQLFIEQRV